jgi:phytanoyl-CoA hydroxylase
MNKLIATSEERPLTVEEMTEYRQKAKVAFQDLEQTVQQQQSSPSSWVRGPDADSEWLQGRSDHCRYFDTHGFLVLPNFVDSETTHALKDQMADLANHDWDPSSKMDSFGTDAASNTARGDYFLDSSNKVHYFAEPTALLVSDGNDDNDKRTNDKQLKPEFQTNKLAALNKAGHGMHAVPGAFCDYTLSANMRELVQDLGWKDPVVPQSMYIFKQPKIGGTVHSHQDSSFLYTTPRQTCLGLWLALDDATLENGCLWVRPGSHTEPLRRQFIRNPDYNFVDDDDDKKKNNDSNDPPTPPQLIFRNHHENPKVTWEGGLPEGSLWEQGFVPVEVKAGDLVVFPGTLDHLSLPNFSRLQRHTFQLHLVEGPNEGVTWSPENWLQYPPNVPFVRLTH